MSLQIMSNQWHSHGGGGGGARGKGRGPRLTAKNFPKIEKRGNKSGKIGNKRQKSGRFFHFAPPDR